MKRLIISAAAVTAVFLALAVLWLTAVPRFIDKRINARSVTVNRLNAELTAMIEDGTPPAEAVSSLSGHKKEMMPDDISFIPAEGSNSLLTAKGSSGSLICPVYKGSSLAGLAVYSYSDPFRHLSDAMVLTVLGICWLLAMALLLYTYLRIIRPFRRLADYPERLARIPDADKLPETNDKQFGRFIWGLNMLGDVLQSERRRSERLDCQQHTLLASIAHGVKTPVMNIRLYSEAIRTGLYSGSEDKNAELAARIDSNAEKIQTLVKELIAASSSAESSYEPQVSQFYLSELKTLISREYTERLRLLRIPFSVECTSDRLVNSDIYGLLRVVSQLIENAVKYGNGEGISILLESDTDGVCIRVKNKGELLPEEELSFIFDSFRRGSNSHGIEGSGIGLFTARSITSALGGSIYARRLEESSEMEFSIYLGD